MNAKQRRKKRRWAARMSDAYYEIWKLVGIPHQKGTAEAYWRKF